MKKYIKIFLIIISSILIIWHLPIPDLIAFKIGRTNKVMGPGVGIAGITPFQYRKFQYLKAVTSTKKLIDLYKTHSKEAVRCYAYWALLERDEDLDYFELIEYGINDTNTVTTAFGCIIGSSTVADFILSESRYFFNGKDSLKLDSIFLFSNQLTPAKEYYISELDPKPQYHDRIRELALTRNSEYAKMALAKYQNINDSIILKSLFSDTIPLSYVLEAVKNYKHNIFKNELLKLWSLNMSYDPFIRESELEMFYNQLFLYDDEIIMEKVKEISELRDTFNDIPEELLLLQYQKYKPLVFDLNEEKEDWEIKDAIRRKKEKLNDHYKYILIALAKTNNQFYDELSKEFGIEKNYHKEETFNWTIKQK